ncbi:DUF433 domain-containing protein [Candidatus Uhrbacteria bacterium]|nr:DUF433 domain-containing protein [Candidatus Uhrbacteria bacterium]
MEDIHLLNRKLMERIEIDPRRLGGKPVIRGTRISVEQVLNILAAGIPTAEILKDFPALTKEDIQAAVYYASKLMEDFKVYPQDYLSQIKMQPV